MALMLLQVLVLGVIAAAADGLCILCLRAPRARAAREYVFTAGGACARLVCVRRGSNTGLTYKSLYTYRGHQVSLPIEAGARRKATRRRAPSIQASLRYPSSLVLSLRRFVS